MIGIIDGLIIDNTAWYLMLACCLMLDAWTPWRAPDWIIAVTPWKLRGFQLDRYRCFSGARLCKCWLCMCESYGHDTWPFEVEAMRMIPTCVSHRIAGTISVERGIGRIKKSSDISWLAHIMNSCQGTTSTWSLRRPLCRFLNCHSFITPFAKKAPNIIDAFLLESR